MKKLIITLDKSKRVSAGINDLDDSEVLYLLMSCLIKVSKSVDLDCEEVTETLEEFWENIE